MHKSHATRLALLFGFLASSCWLAIACSTSVGDGATDDGTTLPPASSAGRNNSAAGAQNQAGATSSLAGTSGTGGAGGSAESGGPSGAGGSIGPGGSSGSVSSGGSTVSAGGSTVSAGGSTGTVGHGGGGTGGTGGDVPAQCGDGIISGAEQCDDKGLSSSCTSVCTLFVGLDCLSCESDYQCSIFTKNCIGSDPLFTSDQQNQCVAVIQCVNTSNCFDDTGSLDATCYCGTLSLADCRAAPFDLTKAGAPKGPCAAAIQAGFSGIAANGDVLDNLSNNKQPSGAALQRLSCQKAGSSGSCAKTCGFSAPL